MRKVLATIFLISFNVYSAPPVAVNGEQQANVYVQNIKVPNNQATKQAGLDTRIETGNSNLLINPSFEHATVNTGWTTSLGTVTAETTTVLEGKKSLKINSAGAGIRLVQASIINAANLKGQQMIARVSVKTDDSAMQVCAIVDNTSTGDTNCIAVPVTTTDIPWRTIEIPFIGGGTSNGIVIKSATTGSSNTYIDDAFVGKMAPFQNVNGAKLVGTVTVTGCASAWNVTGTSFADFGTQTGCTYSATGSLAAPATNIPGFKVNGTLQPGDYRLEYEGAYQSANSSGLASYLQYWDGANTARETSVLNAGTSSILSNGISQTISYSTSQSSPTISIRGKVASGGSLNLFGTTAFPGVFKLWYFPPESRIYSQASQDYDWQAFTATSSNGSFSSFTTNDCFKKRRGGDLWLRCRIAATTNASEARIDLPDSLGVSSTKSPQQFVVGRWARGVATGTSASTVLAVPGSTYLTFSLGSNSGISPLTNQTSTTLVNTGDIMEFDAVIPIQGWQDYGVIVGSFAGIEKANNAYETTDTFSAYVSSSGVVSQENVDWINGNCSNGSTGNYTCTLNSNLKDGVSGLSSPMNCFAIPYVTAGAGTVSNITGTTTSSVSVQEFTSTSGANVNSAFQIKCQKNSQDFAPRTGKIATSIGVPTVPGITTSGAGNAIDTFTVSMAGTNPGTTSATVCSSSPCLIDQFGTSNAVTSITRSATGSYTANFAKTYTKLKCIFASQGAQYTPTQDLSCQSCNSLNILTNGSASNAAQDVRGNLDCKGSY